jgi:hypothetical protein
VRISAKGSNFHAVSVSGPAACGKTHSGQLIRYVAKCSGVTHKQVDVVNALRALTLRQAFEQITLGLNQSFDELRKLLRDDPSDAQAAERFVAWLGGKSQEFAQAGNRFWLTFDGLNQAAAASVRDILVPLLLQAVATGDLQNVKLFLLGDDGRRVREASRYVLHEEATPLTRQEIRFFLQSYAAVRGWSIDDADLDQVTDFVVGTKQWPFDHIAMGEIRDRLEKALPMLDHPQKPVAELLREAGP